jgi:hypothetical protein
MKVEDSTTEYRLISHKISLLIWVVCCGAAIWSLYKLTILVTKNPKLWYLALLSVPIYIYSLFFLFILVDRFRLFVSSEGIKFQFFVNTIYSAWDDVEKIEKIPFQTRLVLRNPSIEKWKYAWLLPLFYARPIQTIPFGKSTWSRFRDLENEMRKYAPHLF